MSGVHTANSFGLPNQNHGHVNPTALITAEYLHSLAQIDEVWDTIDDEKFNPIYRTFAMVFDNRYVLMHIHLESTSGLTGRFGVLKAPLRPNSAVVDQVFAHGDTFALYSVNIQPNGDLNVTSFPSANEHMITVFYDLEA